MFELRFVAEIMLIMQDRNSDKEYVGFTLQAHLIFVWSIVVLNVN